MFSIRYKKDALLDYRDAVSWYKERSPKAAQNFVTEYKNAVDSIRNNPKSLMRAYSNFHQVHLKKYPYTIVYVVEDAEAVIFITAVFHQSRNPRDKFSAKS